MTEISPAVARSIIDRVGGSGTPPEFGFQAFSAGLDPYLSVLDQEYLGSFVRDGGSAFKLVLGIYGGGKTHFLYSVRELAWRHNFAVSYVVLSPGESPFHKWELVYKAIVRGIVPPLTDDEVLSGYEQGIDPFIRRWYSREQAAMADAGFEGSERAEHLKGYADGIKGMESVLFQRAVHAAFHALADGREEDYVDVLQWLSAEGYDRRIHGRFRLLQRIDKTVAPSLTRSLVQFAREIGYSGLVVLFDEGERVSSLTSKQREQHLSNLRELIDECGHARLQGAMILYAVPDENFLDQRGQVYEALKQRLSTVFEDLNPTGVRIELEKAIPEPIPFMTEVGRKLAGIFQIAHDHSFDDGELASVVRRVAEIAEEARYGDEGYKRVFVQRLVPALHSLRRDGLEPTLARLG